MNKTTKIVIGIAGAAAAGAVIGLLIAPKSGSELRNQITKATNDFASSLTDTLTKNYQNIASKKDRVIDEAKGLKDDAQSRYSKVKEIIS